MMRTAIGLPPAAARNFPQLLISPSNAVRSESIGLCPSELSRRTSQLCREARPCISWERFLPRAHSPAQIPPGRTNWENQFRYMYLERAPMGTPGRCIFCPISTPPPNAFPCEARLPGVNFPVQSPRGAQAPNVRPFPRDNCLTNGRHSDRT